MEDGNSDNISRDAAGKPNVPLPYDFETHQFSAPLRRMEDIIAFDKAFRSVTADQPKPILLGSITRLSEIALKNWGIEVTEENRADLMDYAEKFYTMDDFQYTPQKTAGDMLQVYKRKLQSDCLGQMESSSAALLTNMLRSSLDKKNEISICNLAAGAANVVRSVVTTLGCDPAGRGILERTVFHLVDRPERLARAEKNLISLKPRVEWHAKSSAEFLAEMKAANRKFDYMISVSQFHRKPFLSDFLTQIHGIMNDRGLLVAADWHSPLTLYPSGVYELLKALNIPQTKLEFFQDLFGPYMDMDCRTENGTEENKALSDHMCYWDKIASNLGSESTDPHGLKVRIISAFLTQKQLANAIENSGFDVERDKIKTAFPGDSATALPSRLPVRIRNRSDSAVVTLAVRR